MKRTALAAIVLAAAAWPAAPAAAQEAGGEKVNQLIVYGDDPCPPSTGGEITVCARKEEAERYRIPEILRGSASAQNEAWNNKVLAYETVGATGTHSCSPVGAGGSLGCTTKLIDAAFAEKRGGDDVKMGQLIAAEREKRLSTIDAEAAETQARVEQLERDFEAREKARLQAAGEQDTAPAQAAPLEPAPKP
jgi:hypothetical protein